MSFFIDTDILSGHLRAHRAVSDKFLQYAAHLHISVVSLAEIDAWLYRASTPVRYVEAFKALVTDLTILPVDERVAELAGRISAAMKDVGVSVGTPDALLAGTALAHNLTLVTRNTRDFIKIRDLRIVDWMAP
jgi:tRNA(fMet)-specific endonuclease VapC